MNPKNKKLLIIFSGILILFIGIKIGLEIKCARNSNFYQTSKSATVNKTLPEPEEYGGEVLQIGGEGSRIHQVTAHLLTEHGYLTPPEDWIKVFFNNSGDAMTVECKAGYKIGSCVAKEESFIDDKLGCRTTLGDQIKNTVSVTCIKE